MIYNDNTPEQEIGKQVRAILGVPEEILTDDIISSSPVFTLKAEKYINKRIQEYSGLDENLLHISYIYYISYLLCVGMDARLPKQMENLSTKTVLQSIDWIAKSLELLGKCNEIIDDLISEGEDVTLGNTFAVLSEPSQYPNQTI